jgi:hypothetical protein
MPGAVVLPPLPHTQPMPEVRWCLGTTRRGRSIMLYMPVEVTGSVQLGRSGQVPLSASAQIGSTDSTVRANFLSYAVNWACSLRITFHCEL